MISVIVPVYKVEQYIRQCINSLLDQTYHDLEILLIDDGSPDRCGEICNEYARIDGRIRVIHTENKGNSAARNLGLMEARGEYIGFVDSDDWIDTNMYETLLNRLQETEADICTCGYWIEYVGCRHSEGNLKDAIFLNKDTIRAMIDFKINSYPWDKIYKKKCWNGIRFPEGPHKYEDVATLYKVIQQSSRISCVTKPLYHYRMRDNSIIHDNSMKNLVDRWNAYYRRYQDLCSSPEMCNDKNRIRKMEAYLADLGVRTWQNIYSIPPKQRDYDFLHSVSRFEINHFPLFGEKNWPTFFRIKFFFTRHPNEVSFFGLYLLRKIYRLIKVSKEPKLYP